MSDDGIGSGCSEGRGTTGPEGAGGATGAREPALECVKASQHGIDRPLGARTCRTDECELERQARIASLAELVLDRQETLDEGGERPRWEHPGLLDDRGSRLRRSRHRRRQLSELARQEQRPQVVEQIGDEASEILALCHCRVEPAQGTGRIAGDDAVDQTANEGLVGDSEEDPGLFRGDRPVDGGRQLVELGHGVTEAPACRPRNDGEGGCVGLNALGPGDALEHLDQLVGGRTGKGERLAATLDRVEEALRLRRAEYEDDVRWRLFERLQERVRGIGRERVRLVQDVDATSADRRRNGDTVADGPDIIDAAIRGSVEFDHVEGSGIVDRPARLAFEARRDRRRSR